jgi:Regulator of chromosome condensation (RCC1) repeat
VLPKHVDQGGLEDEFVLAVSCGSRHTLAVTEEGEVWSWGLGHFGALGRPFTPFEYDADRYDAVALGGDEAAVPVAVQAAEPQPQPQQPAQQEARGADNFDLQAHLELISNLTLDDSSNQCYPMVIESLQLTKSVGVSAGHRHR